MKEELMDRGYLILKNGYLVAERYFNSSFAKQNFQLLSDLHQMLPFLCPRDYRGISREPLMCDEDLMSSEIDVIENCVFDNLCSAEKVKDATNENEIEIIEISLDIHPREQHFLGFDIGYWGGDCFSVICDSILMPRWHPPDPKDFQEISVWAKLLNKNMLFSDYKLANNFKEYYLTKEWSESEISAEFKVIQICAT